MTRPLSGKRRLGERVPAFSGGKGDSRESPSPNFWGKKAVGVKESRPFLQPKGPAGRRLEPRGKAFFIYKYYNFFIYPFFIYFFFIFFIYFIFFLFIKNFHINKKNNKK